MGDYLKLFVDCLEKYGALNDTEFGRLVRAALSYKATGAEPCNMGRESLLWPGMRLDIDRANKAYADTVAARSEAGKKGAAARWQDNGKNGKCHSAYGKNGQDKDKEKDKEKYNNNANIFAREELAPVLAAYQNRLGKLLSGSAVEEIAGYMQTIGPDVLLHALDRATDKGVLTWAFIRAILRGYERDGVSTLAAAMESDRDFDAAADAGRRTGETRRKRRSFSEIAAELESEEGWKPNDG